MWQYDDSNPSKPKLVHINKNTLEPNKIYKVSPKLNNHKVKTFRNLSFDEDGNFYTDYVKK